MTRALLKTDEPVAYRVVVTHTHTTEHIERSRGRVLPTITVTHGPYGTLGAAKAQAKRETAPRYWRKDSTAVVQAIRAEAWTEVPTP
ncbi:hypothetical protein MTE01_29040 [Microbacterium testaceum]|uniref:Uncharacterized protein n=1 Tax=Microbacterium testaceum TaxID=2033 RepID=A0A4Y3QPX8_MICTE|nr:hypothetical protein [Microbacterium testaceum]GEB46959.1 hypothetical protein MTE01_29040 [Microbacterium testaceum]